MKKTLLNGKASIYLELLEVSQKNVEMLLSTCNKGKCNICLYFDLYQKSDEIIKNADTFM